jgi:hypothetical protein
MGAGGVTAMIPPFDDHGNLPPGVHPATLEEIESRFGNESELRRVQMQSLSWLVAAAQRAGVQKIIVNGSFVCDTLEPNDVDCVLLLAADYPKEESAAKELQDGFPFVEMYLVESKEYDYFVQVFFALDRNDRPKGMLEVTL